MTLPSMAILLKAYFDLELAIAIPFCFTHVFSVNQLLSDVFAKTTCKGKN
jgi:hypothetical protein